MEEKTIITSTKMSKKTLRNVVLILLGLAILFFCLSFITAQGSINSEINEHIASHYNRASNTYICEGGWGHAYNKSFSSAEEFWSHYSSVHGFYYTLDDAIWWDYSACTLLIIHWSLFFITAVYALIWLLFSRCKITITDKNVYGKTAFGKNVVLPLNQISAFGTSKIFLTIRIASSSGTIGFRLIKNYKEIADVLNSQLKDLQQEDSTQVQIQQVQAPSTAIELKQYKELLDSGIITQEEFDAKKKQLLGL